MASDRWGPGAPAVDLNWWDIQNEDDLCLQVPFDLLGWARDLLDGWEDLHREAEKQGLAALAGYIYFCCEILAEWLAEHE